MNRVVFINGCNTTRNKNNVGDNFCSPYLYFKSFYPNSIHVDLDDYSCNNNDVCIIGGGGLFSNWHGRGLSKQVNANKILIWGAGFNIHSDEPIHHGINYEEFLKKCKLVGLRDNPNGTYEFVPCVSCMHPYFSNVYKYVEEDIVIYEHYDKPINLDKKFKKMNNAGNDIESKLDFLSKANKIVTNTYHGLYWSVLLKKKVAIINPFSSRFKNLPFELPIVNENNYNEKLELCMTYDVLSLYREINTNFNDRIVKLIDQKL